MNWQDDGYLLSKKNYSENSIIADVFTLNHGKRSGIIYGGNSSKNKRYLQTGNKIFVSYKSKKENSIGYFATELIKPIAPYLFGDKKRLTCFLSSISILNILLAEGQANKSIFHNFELLIKSINLSNWILSYINWEQNLIKELGFEIKLNVNQEKININNKELNIPEILKFKKIENLSVADIKKALIFNRNLLIENFITPNKLRLPLNRVILEKYF